MFTKQTPSTEALNTVASFYSRLGQAGRKQAEADMLGFKDPSRYRRNVRGRLVFTVVMLLQWVRVCSCVYAGNAVSDLESPRHDRLLCWFPFSAGRVAGLGGRGGLASSLVVVGAALECVDGKWDGLFTFGAGLFVSKPVFADAQEGGMNGLLFASLF